MGICTRDNQGSRTPSGVSTTRIRTFISISGQGAKKVGCLPAQFTTSSSSQTPRRDGQEKQGNQTLSEMKSDRSEWFIHAKFAQHLFLILRVRIAWKQRRLELWRARCFPFPWKCILCSVVRVSKFPLSTLKKKSSLCVIDWVCTSAKIGVMWGYNCCVSEHSTTMWLLMSITLAIKKDVAIYIFNLGNITQTEWW